MLMNAKRGATREYRRSRYAPPDRFATVSLRQLLKSIGRGALTSAQLELLSSDHAEDVSVFYAGDLDLVAHKCVAIVGTREASQEGIARASRLARELSKAGVVIVSGLAKGIDAAAHTGAIEHGGRTVAVIGTPLEKAYPTENAELQERIWREHLLLTPFRNGQAVYRSNFPIRNRVMAALSDATVIIEASDTSGTLHQAAECQRLGRWLFIANSVAEDPGLKWPQRFIGKPKVAILKTTSDVLDVISASP
jgi:DNA processing protein